MKKSLSIFRLLMACLVISLASITAKSFASGDKSAATGTAALTLIALPITLGTSLEINHKKSEWKKAGPIALLTISSPGANVPTIKGPALNNPITEGYSPNSMPAASGGGASAVGSSGMVSSQSEQIFADFSIGRALSFSLTFADTYAGGVVPLLPQYTNDALPTGVTFSSGGTQFSTYQAFVNYFCKFPTLFTKLTVTVDDTANFDKELRLTRTNPDGNVESASGTWNRFALDPYARVQTVRTLQKNFVSGTDMRYELVSAVIPDSGLTKVWTFVFDIARVANSFNFIMPRS